MRDEKPQAEDETDEAPEETYIDAFGLSFNHSTSDIYIPLGASEMALGVKRSNSPLIFNTRSGWRPWDEFEEKSNPFGVCWSSSVAPKIVFSQMVTFNSGFENVSSPGAIVTDENGSTYKFIKYYKPGTNGETTVGYFPSAYGKQDAKFYTNKLEVVGNPTGPATYIFSRKFGNTIQFSQVLNDNGTPYSKISDAPRTPWTYDPEEQFADQIRYTMARADWVEDRLGQRITYSYDEDEERATIPEKISSGSQELIIERGYISPDPNDPADIGDHLITKITDPRGNFVEYEYEKVSKTFSSGVGPSGTAPSVDGYYFVLKTVRRPDCDPIHYDYESVQESDTHVPGVEVRVDHHQMNLTQIDQGGSVSLVTYGFWDNDGKPVSQNGPGEEGARYSLMVNQDFVGYRRLAGLPRYVIGSSSPAGGASYKLHAFEKLDYTFNEGATNEENGNPLQDDPVRWSIATPSEGAERTYYFEDQKTLRLDFFQSGGVIQSSTYPLMLMFERMRIDYGAAPGTGGDRMEEIYEFDFDVGLALSYTKDICGNETYFHYDDSYDLDDFAELQGVPTELLEHIEGQYPEYWPDPTRQVNDVGLQKVFAYDPESRFMTQVENEEGHVTTWILDAAGNRIEEHVEAYGTYPQVDNRFGYIQGFMEEKWIYTLGGGAPTIRTQYEPDSNFYVAEEEVVGATPQIVTKHTHDMNGNRLSTEDPLGNVTDFEYDDFNRLKKIIHPDDGTGYRPFRENFYDGRGNKIREIDENGINTFYEYDNANRVIKITVDADKNGIADTDRAQDVITEYAYNAANQKTLIIDPIGKQTVNEYDDLFRLVKVTDGDRVTELFYEWGQNFGGGQFDYSSFKPTKVIDSRGYVTLNTYDSLYRLTNTKTYFDAPGVTTGRHTNTDTTYDAIGNPVKVKVTVTGSGGPIQEIRTEFDALGRPTKVTYPDLDSIRMEYTGFGEVSRSYDEYNRATTTVFDGAGRPIQTILPEIGYVDLTLTPSSGSANPTTTTAYDAAGNVVSVTGPRGSVTSYQYDERNRRTHEILPTVTYADSGGTSVTGNPTVVTEYDDAGNVLTVTDARGNVTANEYDGANRVTKTILPLPGAPYQETTYDGVGNALTVRDANGHVTTNVYTQFGELESTTDPENILVSYEYDDAGNQTKVTDGESQETTFEYDGLGRVTKETYHNGDFASFEYNELNKTRRIDALGRKTDYEYDIRNRLTDVRYLEDYNHAENRQYTYDKVGNILTVTEPNRSDGIDRDVTYTYNEINLMLSEVSSGETVEYTYDLAGNRTSQLSDAIPGVSVFADALVSEYDAHNRLSSVTKPGDYGDYVQWGAADYGVDYVYDANGNIFEKSVFLQSWVSQTPPGGSPPETTTRNQYDEASRLVQREIDHEGQSLGTITFAYDDGGNLLSQQVVSSSLQNRMVTNTYEDNDRLDTETIVISGGGTTYTDYEYDDANNRISKIVVEDGGAPETTNYFFDYGSTNGLNQLLAYGPDANQTDPGNTSLVYDLNGNRTQRNKPDGSGGTLVTDYTYDLENRLVRVDDETASGDDDYEYAYDYRTRRVSRIENGDATRIFFSGGLSLGEFRDAGTGNEEIDVEYIRVSGLGGGIGGISHSIRYPDQTGSLPSVRINQYNGRGDVIVQTDEDGDVEWQGSYEAFGTRYYEDGQSEDRQKANTKEEEPWGGLNEGMRIRDLDADVFLTKDPAGFVDGPNVYTYVRQNPWTMWDPHGLSPAWQLHHPVSGHTTTAADIQAAVGIMLSGVVTALNYIEEKGQDGLATAIGGVKDDGNRASGGERAVAAVVGGAYVASELVGGPAKKGGQELLQEGGEQLLKKGDAALEKTARGTVEENREEILRIDDGVRRSKSQQMTGNETIEARIKREGQPDEVTEVPIDDLGSPKESIPLDERFTEDNLQRAIEGSTPPPIEVTPVPAQTPGLTPVDEIKLVPPGSN